MILLDGCADAQWESGLGKRNGDATVGKISGRADELALGQDGEQRVQIGFRFEVERWRLAPNAAENRLGIFRGAEDDQFGRDGRCGFGTGFGWSCQWKSRARGLERTVLLSIGAGWNGTLRFGFGSSSLGTGQSSTMASPARLKCAGTAFVTSSRMPTIPSTGVG